MLSFLLSRTRTPNGACSGDKILEGIRIRVDWKFDLNALRVDVTIFESAEKELRIKKYPDVCVDEALNSLMSCANASSCIVFFY